MYRQTSLLMILRVNKLKRKKKVFVNLMKKKPNENMPVNKPCTKEIQELWKVLNKVEIKRCKISMNVIDMFACNLYLG